MMRRIISGFVGCGIFALLVFATELPDQWRSWRYSRVVRTSPQTDANGPAELVLPWDIYGHCQPGCADVRIVNANGQEIPYVVEGRRAPRNVEEHPARIIENSFVANEYTQIIGDLGEAHAGYDRVKLQTSRPDFIVWAEVALSDDAKTWRIVEARAPIARFRSRAVDGTQMIPFQGLSSRYIRVRIEDQSAQFPVSGINVLNEEEYQV